MEKFSKDLNELVRRYENKEVTIAEIAENLKVSAGFVKTYLTAGIAGEMYNPDKCNPQGLLKVLKKAEIEPSEFSFEGWKEGEKPQPKVIIDWKIDQRCTFSNSHGQQSPVCVYQVVWLNEGYLLVVPVENLAVNEKGLTIDNPRILSKLVASNMKPIFSAE